MEADGGLVWRQRRWHYVAGVACLAVAIVLYLVGHIAPYWARNTIASLNIGIWFQCPDNGGCFKYNFGADLDYRKAVRILQLIGLLGLLLAMVVAIFVNCRRHHPGPSYVLEIIIFVSATIGLSGAVVFLHYTLPDFKQYGFLSYGWAFAFNLAACVIALMAAALIFCPKLRCRDDNCDNNSANSATASSTTAVAVPKSPSTMPYMRDFRRMDGAEDPGRHGEFANDRGGPYGYGYHHGNGNRISDPYHGRTLAAANTGPSMFGGGHEMTDSGGRYGSHHVPHHSHHSNYYGGGGGRMLNGSKGPAGMMMNRPHSSNASLYDYGQYEDIMDVQQHPDHFFQDVPHRDYEDPDHRNPYVPDPTSSAGPTRRGLPKPGGGVDVTAFRSSNSNANGAPRSGNFSHGGPGLSSERNWQMSDDEDPTWYRGGRQEQRGGGGSADGYRYPGDGGMGENALSSRVPLAYPSSSSPSRYASPNHPQQTQMTEMSVFRLPRIALHGQFEPSSLSGF